MEAGAQPGAVKVASLTAAIACIACVGLGLSLSTPLLSIEMKRMGLSGSWIGLNTAVAGAASVMAIPFVPRLAARIGVVPLLWGSLATAALALLAFKAVPVFAWWFPIRFIFSVAIGALFVMSEFWINEAAPEGRRGLVMGVYATILALGLAAGPLLLTLLGSEGWAPYGAGAVLFCLGGLPLLAARGLSPVLDGAPRRTVWSFIRTAPSATLAALVFGAAETGSFALLPIYGLRVGLSEGEATLLVTALALGNVVFQIPFGLLSDRMDRRRLLLGATLVGALGAASIPSAGNGVPLYLLLFVWGGIIGALYTVGLAHLGARFGGGDLAAANAAFLILYTLGMTGGPPLVGAGMDLVGPPGFAWSLAVVFAAYAFVVLDRMHRERTKS